MAQSINLPIDEWKEKFMAFYGRISDWLKDFFRTITTYESIAVGVIGIGFILFIVGLIVI